MKYCCDGLKHLVARAGLTGFSVELVEGEGTPFFAMVFRSYTEARRSELHAFLAAHPDGPAMTLGETVPLKYCPWCGTNLQRVLVTKRWT